MLIHRVNRINQRRFAEVRPHVYQDGDSVTMQFRIGEIQSEMLVSDPTFLVLSYTRTMMAFLLVHEAPERIAMIGLGGGPMPKWCYHQLPSTDITVIETSPMVISLREQFIYLRTTNDSVCSVETEPTMSLTLKIRQTSCWWTASMFMGSRHSFARRSVTWTVIEHSLVME